MQCTLPASPLRLSQQGRELQHSLEGARAAQEEVPMLPGGRRAALAAPCPGLGRRSPQQALSIWILTGMRKRPGEVLQMKHFVAKKQI